MKSFLFSCKDQLPASKFTPIKLTTFRSVFPVDFGWFCWGINFREIVLQQFAAKALTTGCPRTNNAFFSPLSSEITEPKAVHRFPERVGQTFQIKFSVLIDNCSFGEKRAYLGMCSTQRPAPFPTEDMGQLGSSCRFLPGC